MGYAYVDGDRLKLTLILFGVCVLIALAVIVGLIIYITRNRK